MFNRSVKWKRDSHGPESLKGFETIGRLIRAEEVFNSTRTKTHIIGKRKEDTDLKKKTLMYDRINAYKL